MPTQKSFVKDSPFPPLEKGKLRLYSMRFCPYAQRTRLILAHKNIPYETVNINLKRKPDWFLERNPLGMVPILEKDDKIVHESAICNDYLDEVYPDRRLNPTDPYLRARDRILLERFGKVTTQHYKMLFSKGANREAKESYVNNLDVFEAELAKRGDYFGGKAVSNLDLLLWPFFERWVILESVADWKPDSKRHPKLIAWVGRMYEEPAVKACMFDQATHLAFISPALAGGEPNYDYGL